MTVTLNSPRDSQGIFDNRKKNGRLLIAVDAAIVLVQLGIRHHGHELLFSHRLRLKHLPIVHMRHAEVLLERIPDKVEVVQNELFLLLV